MPWSQAGPRRPRTGVQRADGHREHAGCSLVVDSLDRLGLQIRAMSGFVGQDAKQAHLAP